MMEQQLITGTLAEREARIERLARRFWYDTALEYQQIRDGREYKQAGWSAWEDYCQERWARSHRHINDQIQRANDVREMGEISPISQDQLPASMSHATALSKLDKPEHRAQVWQSVVTGANGQGITAKMVEAEVERFKKAQDKNWITLSEWEAGERWHGAPATSTMNKVNDNIEWAAWSWNPITGCLHNCDYCYARDMANRIYPQKFEPAFIPARLVMPDNTKPLRPRWNGDTGHHNVFTCSMADLFGKWVPAEWIEAVLESIERNSKWTFLLLTKFPIRMAEFDYPPNVWLGTTVDYQHAIHRAQQGFRKIKASGFEGVCWLSCEPMMERLTFGSLDMFDWLVMGGSSRSTQTPEYRPPFSDIVHLYDQAKRLLDLPVYMKTNLIPGMSDEQRIREYPGATNGR